MSCSRTGLIGTLAMRRREFLTSSAALASLAVWPSKAAPAPAEARKSIGGDRPLRDSEITLKVFKVDQFYG